MAALLALACIMFISIGGPLRIYAEKHPSEENANRIFLISQFFLAAALCAVLGAIFYPR